MDDGAVLSADADVDGGSMIPDLSEVPLEVLFRDDDSALGGALRRVNQPAEDYAAHSSST